MSQWSFEEYYQPCIPQGQKEWHGIIVQADLAWMPGRCNWENRTSKERNEPEIILDEVARKELGHREWKLSLRGILFCPRKWIPNRSPVDLLPAVGEGVVVPQSVVELYNNTGVHLGHLSAWRLLFRRSGVGPWASSKNQSSPSLLWSSSQWVLQSMESRKGPQWHQLLETLLWSLVVGFTKLSKQMLVEHEAYCEQTLNLGTAVQPRQNTIIWIGQVMETKAKWFLLPELSRL